jgi:hypothetical protein
MKGFCSPSDQDFWQITIQERTPLDRGGVIFVSCSSGDLGEHTPLVWGAVDSPQEWKRHASVVTPDGVLMVRLRGKEEV